MSILYKIIFIVYDFLWVIAPFFLRLKKRIRDGIEQRQIPSDWMTQKIIINNNSYFNLEKDKIFFWAKMPISKQEINSSLFENKKNIKTVNVENVDLWLQAASGGEAYLVADFLKNLPKSKRHYNILITTWTREGMNVLEKECGQIFTDWQNENVNNSNSFPNIFIRFASFDKKSIVKKAFNQAKPRLCIMFETELWPNFMLECKERKIPLYVINARMTKASYECYKVISSMLKQICPKEILATTQEDMIRFSKIFPSSLVSFMPNMKFERAINLTAREKNVHIDFTDKVNFDKLINIDNINTQEKNEINSKPQVEVKTSYDNKIKNIKTKFLKKSKEKNINLDQVLISKKYFEYFPHFFSNTKSVFLFASLRKKEENLLAATIWKAYLEKKQSIFIVVPKHSDRFDHWYTRFYDLGIEPVLASDYLTHQNYDSINTITPFSTHQCIIWDIFGDLTKLYNHADFAFVGGSFKNLGGQNFLEALAGGVCPHLGPDLDNFLWALGNDHPPSLAEKKLIHRCKSRKELKKAIYETAEHKIEQEKRLYTQKQFTKWLEKYQGSCKLIVEKILQDTALK